MIETLIKNWWLLFLRGILAFVLAVMTFLILPSVDTFTLRPFALRGMVVLVGMMAVAAGVCTFAAGVWRSGMGKWWLLALEGVIVTVAGVVIIQSSIITMPILIYAVVVLATGAGVIELAVASTIRRHLSDEWFLGLAGAGSIGFALAFFLIGPREERVMLIWLGFYSAFSAICILALSFRLRALGSSIKRLEHAASR